MRRTFTFTAAAALAGLLAVSLATSAAPPPNAGGGGSSGGGGGGGGTPGGGAKTPPDYGDLWILYRDGNGVPYVTPYSDNGTSGDPSDDTGLCQQPLPADTCPTDCIVGGVPSGTSVVAVDPATCAVPSTCPLCTQEVEFERDNVIRAKESVLAQQLEDATIKLATAGCVTLDPAGRPVASSVVDGESVSSAIDSPLQNLGFYKQLMQYGYVGSAANPIDLRNPDWLVSAARALGASMPKEGKATVDMVVYMNEILGLTENEGASLLPLLFQDVREEVMGEMQVVRKYFLDYGDGEAVDFAYSRYENFMSLPDPAYIAYDGVDDVPGAFEFTEEVTLPDGTVAYIPTTGLILDNVPELAANQSLTGSLLTGFAQAVDDSRAVINFMHTWPVLGDNATPIPCAVETPDYYDVSISERSGLQVPRRMAAAGDGREGIVTVHNAGPADAEGVCIQVTGVFTGADGTTDDVVLQVSITDTAPIFADGACVYRDVAVGIDESVSFFFAMDVATKGEIAWEARVTGANDVNEGNDLVEKVTIVSKPTGTGGGEE